VNLATNAKKSESVPLDADVGRMQPSLAEFTAKRKTWTIIHILFIFSRIIALVIRIWLNSKYPIFWSALLAILHTLVGGGRNN